MGTLAPQHPARPAPGRAAVGPVEDPPGHGPGQGGGLAGIMKEVLSEGRGRTGRRRAHPHLLLEPPGRTGVRGRSDCCVCVLGGRGAVENEEDLPELSDSGDEAAWEDEDDADLPHDKQQTPCLFCNRFVRLSAWPLP